VPSQPLAVSALIGDASYCFCVFTTNGSSGSGGAMVTFADILAALAVETAPAASVFTEAKATATVASRCSCYSSAHQQLRYQ